MNACMMILIVIGSLGAPVVRDVAKVVASRRPRRFAEERVRLRPSAQTRITLAVTLAMLLVGFVGFFFCERGGGLAGLSLGRGSSPAPSSPSPPALRASTPSRSTG